MATRKTVETATESKSSGVKGEFQKVFDKNKGKLIEGVVGLAATALLAAGTQAINSVKSKIEVKKIIKDLKYQLDDIAANPRTMTETKINRVRKELDAILNKASSWKHKKKIMELQDRADELLSQFKKNNKENKEGS